MQAIPVHILTGFLGAGKTTLLNRALQSPAMENTAIIVNEFGEIGVDHLLVEASDDTILELSNGCLCCTIRGELVDTIVSLSARKFDRLIIETTGLADPAPVAQAILGHPDLSRRFRLQSIITVVDCLNALSDGGQNDDWDKQIALADLTVLSKTDLTAEFNRVETEQKCRAAIELRNPHTQIFNAAGIEDAARIFRDFDGTSAPTAAKKPSPAHAPPGLEHERHKSGHTRNIRSTVLRHPKPMQRQTLDHFMEKAIAKFGDCLLRIKGLVYIDEHPEQPLVVHGVQNIFHEPSLLKSWPDYDPSTALVVITNAIDPGEVERLFFAFLDQPQIDTPDRAALSENPLAIPGV